MFWILSTEWQCYLPAYDECSIVFLREILSRKKLVLKNWEVRSVNCPKLTDFNADQMYTKALTDELVNRYLPTPTKKKIRGVSRKYLFDVSTPA